jgi:hypothetical protein
LRIPSQTFTTFFSQLPLENWADLLPFVPRHQLVEIIKQLGDRQFASILQFFLTEVGQITLGHLRIVAPREDDPNGGGPIVEVRKSYWSEWRPRPQSHLETNLPEGPMPTNVKAFNLIELRFAIYKLIFNIKKNVRTLKTIPMLGVEYDLHRFCILTVRTPIGVVIYRYYM